MSFALVAVVLEVSCKAVKMYSSSGIVQSNPRRLPSAKFPLPKLVCCIRSLQIPAVVGTQEAEVF
jgi:hypothetical protein